MTETTHSRSRRASLGGLVLQVLAFGITLVLGITEHSWPLQMVAWHILGGVPIWFVALLIFRQRELAAFEAMDLEELRREREAGRGEGLFDASGFRIAETRLRWMRRWLVPAFALIGAAYLVFMGLYLWQRMVNAGMRVGQAGWMEMPVQDVPLAMAVLTLVMVGLFLYSRYASGMGRVREWQLLRACGSFMLGNAIVLMAMLVTLGVYYQGKVMTWQQTLAYVIPAVMIVLGIEMVINFILDIYRPRVPGVEPRAAFDSRLLGLFAEPGGIASSIADAINYQFGFQVSQTWFYQLLQRALLPLIGTGAVALWLLTCLIVVQPYEHVIVERFGRQLNASAPFGPGLHFKFPYPIDISRTYSTGRLHQIHVGFKAWDAEPTEQAGANTIQLWTDEKHLGQDHFDFIVCPTPWGRTQVTTRPADGSLTDSPVHLVRMDVAVQYRIDPARLADYSQAVAQPEVTLRNLAWAEVARMVSSFTVDGLLGQEIGRLGRVFRERIAKRADELRLGLEIVYVGVTNIHPERTVAQSFRDVVKAEQQKTTSIREALVLENQTLSNVAGDAVKARQLARAVQAATEAGSAQEVLRKSLDGVDPALLTSAREQLKTYEPLFLALVDAQADLSAAEEARLDFEQSYELGLGRTLQERDVAEAKLTKARTAVEAARKSVEEAVAPLRRELGGKLTAEQAHAVIGAAVAQVARQRWDDILAAEFTPTRLEGAAARRLAEGLAQRWRVELDAARNFAEVIGERNAFRAAPEVYKARRLVEVLAAGLKDARKYFMAFDPAGRTVRVRIISEDEAWTPLDITPGAQPQ